MNLEAIQKIKTTLESYDRYVILPHIMPDGDTIGSSAALAHFLHQMGKQAVVLVEDTVPANLKLIPRDLFVEKEEFVEPMGEYVVIAVDSSDIGRLGDRIAMLPNCSLLAVIDHHRTNTLYGDINYVDEHASSTGEIVFELAGEFGFALDTIAATALYIALTTDTGGFRYDNTTPKTMQIASTLMSAGIDTHAINTELYQNQPMNKVMLLMHALENMRLVAHDRVALVPITAEMMQSHRAIYEDTDGISEYVRSIQGIEVVSLFKELGEGHIKVSMRSKFDFDVSELSLRYGGGGHKRAAGCTLEMSMNDAMTEFEQAILEQMGL